MTKRVRNLLIILSSVILIFFSIYLLSISRYLEIEEIIITIDDGEVPPSLKKSLNQFKYKNILRINTRDIDELNMNNAFISDSKSKITISKKMIINLKKREVNVIMRALESNDYYIFSDNEIYLTEKEDRALIDNNLLLVEISEDTIKSLKNSNDLMNFKQFVGYIDIIYDYNYLISSVKYDNNINNSFGFFELKLKNKNNMLIRVREQVEFNMIQSALELSQTVKNNENEITVLDVYQEAIVLRNLSFGG